jgi:hypothetical protein
MEVSLSWIGVILVTVVILYFSWYGITIYESFVNEEKDKEVESFVGTNFNGINITTCPAGSQSFIDKKGITMCCNGESTSDSCNGQILCSLSKSIDGVPTCTEWYSKHLKERGAICPASMPNYFQGKKVKGCTSGKLNTTATAPSSIKSKKCIFYSNRLDDEGKLDSCTNIKLLESTKCFSKSNIPVEKELIPIWNEKLPAFVMCKYGSLKNNNTGACQDDASWLRVMRGYFNVLPEEGSLDKWKSDSATWSPEYKLNFCSIVQKYKFDKTLAFADLPTAPVFPVK